MLGEDEPRDAQEELQQLLDELRVILPGVEILFAFLLTVPFTSRFREVTVEQETTYFVAFFSAALAVTFLIAPAMLHRIQRNPDDMEQLLRTATQLAIVGAASMAVTVTAVVFLITQLLFSVVTGSVVAAGLAGVIATLWFGLPLYRRL